ncbi:MAG: helix-turn-helix domain-containing protein [Halanaeroarchaeum sp.]
MAIRQLPNSLPSDLESPRGKLVYLYLAHAETATLAELQDGLDLGALTLYSVLKTLRDRGLVERDGERFTARPV